MPDIRTLTRLCAVAILTLVSTACASAGGGGNGDGASFVRMDMGVATAANIADVTRDVFRQKQFQIFREDPPPAPMIESEWRNQTPLDDERALGVTEVQARIIVRGRERSPMGGLRVFQTSYTMETMVKTAAAPDWHEMPVTSEREKMARDIGQELKTQLAVARR